MSVCRTLVFTGNGKGKTTAALGMVLRAVGHGIPAKVVQFIKADTSTGEISALRTLSAVELVQTGLGFVPPRGSAGFEDHAAAARRGLDAAREAIGSHRYGLVVLDEVCTAVWLGLLEESTVIDAVKLAAEECVVVLTGRGATPAIIDLADTATEMREIKHGISCGWPARKGVEF